HGHADRSALKLSMTKRPRTGIDRPKVTHRQRGSDRPKRSPGTSLLPTGSDPPIPQTPGAEFATSQAWLGRLGQGGGVVVVRIEVAHEASNVVDRGFRATRLGDGGFAQLGELIEAGDNIGVDPRFGLLVGGLLRNALC